MEPAFGEQEFQPVQLGNILQEVKNRIKVVPDQSYCLLGVRWWGEGVFIREEKLGREINAANLFRVQAGWIIYNRLFAFRGSFAILNEEHDSCYVSGEFPTFTVRPDIEDQDLVSKYIVHCMNSPQYLQLVDALSTGSTKTSRNRLNQKQFLNMKIKIPKSREGLRNLVVLLDRASDLRSKQAELLTRIKKLREDIASFLPM